MLLQISSVEKEGRQVIDRELTSLRQQVVMTTERAHSLQVELEVTKSELKHTKVCWIQSVYVHLPVNARDECHSTHLH